jgi:hypothetical protein
MRAPAVLVQAACLGVILTVLGLVVLAGGYGDGAATRWIGVLITIVGVLFVVLAVVRLRR